MRLLTILTLTSIVSVLFGGEAGNQPPVKPAWAATVAQDAQGYYADLQVAGVTQRMRWIPAGRFQMGSENGDPGEKPVHTVEITQPFWLGDSEVTQGLWHGVMSNNPSQFTGDTNRPVERVHWTDCQRFIKKLNDQVPGLRAMLPTEAQWEYACRAGTTGDYAGDLDAMAWYRTNAGEQTRPVKTKQANAWGLYDMHGNVWEWCADLYRLASYTSESQRDPTGSSSPNSEYVFRGGGWSRDAWVCRSAFRGRRHSDCPYQFLGFRLAAQATP